MEAGRLGSNHRLEGFFPDYSSSSIIADVIICENMFGVLTSSSSSAGTPLRFFVYEVFKRTRKVNIPLYLKSELETFFSQKLIEIWIFQNPGTLSKAIKIEHTVLTLSGSGTLEWWQHYKNTFKVFGPLGSSHFTAEVRSRNHLLNILPKNSNTTSFTNDILFVHSYKRWC